MGKSILLAAFLSLSSVPQAAAGGSDPSVGAATLVATTDLVDHGKGLKEVVDNSGQLSAWGLAVLGGSVAAVVSASYIRPAEMLLRLPYLLFIPGWVCALWSVYLGNSVSRRYLAWLTSKPEQVRDVPRMINEAFASQMNFLLASLSFFGVWLLVFLLIWIFSKDLKKDA